MCSLSPLPLSAPSPDLNSALVRRRFARAAATYAGASRLEAEAGERMLQRLDYVRLGPRRILDAGSGPGRDAANLKRRYPGAEVVALDAALALLPRAGWMDRIRGRKTISVCGELDRLPFVEASFELGWSNMALHWINDPLVALRELERVLVPEGLVMFSTLGPDTLKELRAAVGGARVHAFIDMHDLGDMLVAAGFSAPVMDMEMLRVEYESGLKLLDDLRASGQTNARRDRPRGLAGRGLRERLERALGGRMHSTYEVIYGHAWKRASGRTAAPAKTIRFHEHIS